MKALFCFVIMSLWKSIYKESEPETLEFMCNLQSRIERNWDPPKKAKKSNSVKVIFEVEKSGLLKSAKVSLSSDDPDYDKAALDAVKSAKIPPLPDNLPEPQFSGGLFSELFKHCGALSCLKLFACKRTRQLMNAFKRCWFYYIQFATNF